MGADLEIFKGEELLYGIVSSIVLETLLRRQMKCLIIFDRYKFFSSFVLNLHLVSVLCN